LPEIDKVAKALLDNRAAFTIFILSTCVFSGLLHQMQALLTPVSVASHKTTQHFLSQISCILLLVAVAYGAPLPSAGAPDETPKLEVRIEAPESDVLAAVQQVTQDQIIHGTYSYDKERVLYGAHSASAAHVFGVWKGPGKAFYKVAGNVLSPRYFKDTGDVGTITVRYVVESADANATILKIDAVFVDARTSRHPSLGNVEAAEHSAIEQHLKAIQSKRQEPEQNSVQAGPTAAPAAAAVQSPSPLLAGTPLTPSSNSVPAMQKHIDALQHEVELRVKDQGAQLKSAPFHGSATLESIPAQSTVLIVVLTPYWYGVETEDGHRGWVHHSQLEPLP
jgi:hypothetical protein